MADKAPKHILPIIVLAQFTGTSLWFAGNAVVSDIILELDLLEMFIGYITMAVQAGFIVGTLIFAFLNVADRFSPVKVFLWCAVGGSLANLMTIWSGSFTEVMIARFATGIFLAGIYPVGMKIAADWHKEGLGKALGYLVGALVVGTAFPHLLKFLGGDLPWRFVLVSTSILATAGGVLLYATVDDGPYRKPSAGFKFKVNAISNLFKNKNFRSAAFGYFGHMWELYTFWAFVPVMLAWYVHSNSQIEISVSFWSFVIIGIGGISCVIGGYWSIKKSSKWVSKISLAVSGLCCLLIPFGFNIPLALFLLLLLIWGIFVIPDSPQFSTMVAQSSESSYVATGLTIVNSLGFAITIVSIQLVNWIWADSESVFVFWVMALGPLVGFWAINRYKAEV
ncbi:MAG: MFS transporter [Balneola sp.]|jgi:MFS family permease|nr:MFS transporter [Balneola sp.]MBE77867.1 MFS transporter [Balneola sp.]|tara:strand:- start:929 stop:2110 length:1182 start_codon:yes stop_codon:yes gene_type:complete